MFSAGDGSPTQCPSPTISTSRTVSRTTGVSGQLVLDMFTLENDVSQRCLSAQPFPQRYRGSTRASVLTTSATSPLQLICRLTVRSSLSNCWTHRWWSEAEDPDTGVNDVYPLVAAAYICIEMHSARYPDPAPCQLPDPRQPARSLTDLLTTRSCGRRIWHPGVSELRVDDPHTGRLGWSLRGSLLLEGPASSAVLSAGDVAHCNHCSRGALCIANDCVKDRPLSLDSTPSRIGSSAWFLSYVIWVCLLQAGDHWCEAALVRSASLDAPPLALTMLLSLALLQNVRSRKLLFFFSSQFEFVD